MRDLRPRVALEAGETSRQLELDEDVAAPVVAPSVGDAVRGLHLARFGAPRRAPTGTERDADCLLYTSDAADE